MTSLGRVALVPPPSANRLWATFRGRTVRTKAATDWMTYAAAIIAANIRPASGPVFVSWRLRMGKGVMITADGDNFQKILFDTLKSPSHHKETGQITKPGAGIVEDDNFRWITGFSFDLLPEVRESKSKRGEAEIFVEVFQR